MIRLALIASLAACAPNLTAQSVAPPGRTARLDELTGFWGSIKSYRLELSQGVALAFTCYRGAPCEHVRVTSDDPRIAEVRTASLGVLERSGLANQAGSAASIVVGKAPGLTKVHVHSEEGDREIAVTIVAPPVAAAR